MRADLTKHGLMHPLTGCGSVEKVAAVVTATVGTRICSSAPTLSGMFCGVVTASERAAAESDALGAGVR
jgi:hypothetical protein